MTDKIIHALAMSSIIVIAVVGGIAVAVLVLSVMELLVRSWCLV